MFNFPDAPITGQVYAPFQWDGEKWTAMGGTTGKTVVYTDGSKAMTAQLTLITPPIATTDAAAKAYVDSGVASRLAVAGGQTLTGGFNFTPYNRAAGSFTINALNGNYQYTTNSAAFTITAPATDSAVDLLVTNAAGAGAITFSGFTVGANVGDALTTNSGDRFIISFRRINGVSTYVIKALQ